MGASESKPSADANLDRLGSLRRSSKNRKSSKSKGDQLDSISSTVHHLKNEIDIFEGNRSSDRYKQFQEILTTLSKNAQQIKTKSKKQEQRDRCDQTLGEVQNCFQRLETRVNFNEQTDRTLDLAAVESHSFINQNFNNQRPPPPALLNEKWAQELPQPNKQRQPKFDSIKNIERLEQETQNLEQEIKKFISLEDYKQFTILEKKIEILYTDLEMIRVDEHTPLSEKKISIGKRLIKCNNQIKRARKSLETRVAEYSSKQDGPIFSKPSRTNTDYGKEIEDWPEDFSRIEAKLEELEIEALTFEGIKSDRKYKELEQILESYWTKVYSMDAFGNKEKRRKELIIERVKNIMQELRKRAEENEKQALAIKDLRKIEQEVQVLKKKSNEFQGAAEDNLYVELDQKLRSAWANLAQVDEPNEHVRRSKARVVQDIQDVLKRFSQGTQQRESKIYENTTIIQQAQVRASSDDDILQSQLLKQVKEFQNHWNQLNYNLDVQKITKSDVSNIIVEIFEKVADGINKKRNALVIIEKRKSTGSLVVAKVIDNTDKLTKITSGSIQDLTSPTKSYQHDPVPSTFVNHQNYNVTPDLLQKQTSPVAKIMETDIKVQPTVKTIGEMQRVGTEAKLLLQQIRQSTCLKYDNEYNQLYGKLEHCRRTLENIQSNKKSETIESNRRRAHKTISEAFRALEEKGTKSPDEQQRAAAIRSSRAQEVMDIDAELQYFRQQIKIFTGVTKDKQYEKIKQGLSDCLTKLQLLDDMHMSKQDSIRHIQQYHQELETKLAENQAKVRVMEQNALVKRQISQDLRATIEQVQKLKGQVERFSGVYDGLYYKQIAQQLEGCTQALDKIDTKGDAKLEHAKLQTKDKIRKYMLILEDKSNKAATPQVEETVDQSNQGEHSESTQPQTNGPVSEEQNHTPVNAAQHVQLNQARKSQLLDPNSPHYKINSLRDKLIEIKSKTETFSGVYKDELYRNIEMDMINCMEELKFIEDRGHKSVIISKQQYEDYIDKLMHYFEEKSKLNETETLANEPTKEPEVQSYSRQPIQSLQTFKIVDPTEELTVIESKIKELKGRIENFEGTPDDVNYKDIYQAVESQTAKLNQVEAGNVAHVREMKKKLVQELVNCSKLLQEKANTKLDQLRSPEVQKQFDKIEEILNEVNLTSKEVYEFTGTKNDRDFCYLDEVLIRLMIQLDNTETYGNNELKDARKSAIQLIQKTMKILSDRAKPKEEAVVNLTPSVI